MLKSFRTKLILRLLLVMLVMAADVLIMLHFRLLFASLILSALLVFQIWELIRFIDKTNVDLSRFLLALKHDDLSLAFNSSKEGQSFKELHESFQEVINHFQKNNIKKEQQLMLLNQVAERISIGLIITNKSGDIVLMNDAVKELFGVVSCSSIDQLNERIHGIGNLLNSASPNERRNINSNVLGEEKSLSLERIQIKTDSQFDVFLINDVHLHKTNTEMDSWLNLIRILTHEIANSITAISSLANTAAEIANRENSSDSIQEALSVIGSRSNGLLTFVSNYRKLTQVPKPNKNWFNISEFVEEQISLHQSQLNKKEISIETRGQKTLNLNADKVLIGQVMSNLLLNAMEALKDTSPASILISWEKSNQETTISIENNGPVIDAQTLNEVFIPFFSTKESGSGIGLSLSRQIMRLHDGKISVQSTKDKTSFKLTFKD